MLHFIHVEIKPKLEPTMITLEKKIQSTSIFLFLL